MSLLPSVLSVPSLQGWQSHPCWTQGNGYREWRFQNCSPQVFEGSVVLMVHITQYGILILYRHKWICMLRCIKWQKHPQHIIKNPRSCIRERMCCLAQGKPSNLSALKEPATKLFWQFYMVHKRELCLGQVRLEVFILFFLLLSLTWWKSTRGGRARGCSPSPCRCGTDTWPWQCLSLLLCAPDQKTAARATQPQCCWEVDVSKRTRIWLRDLVIRGELNLHSLMKMAIIHILFSL